jgi:hypothetical protein
MVSGERALLESSRSKLSVELILDSRYQDFPSRAVSVTVLGFSVKVATLPDLFQGKLWLASDPQRPPSKRIKDELDLLRIAEAFPAYVAQLPTVLRAKLDA